MKLGEDVGGFAFGWGHCGDLMSVDADGHVVESAMRRALRPVAWQRWRLITRVANATVRCAWIDPAVDANMGPTGSDRFPLRKGEPGTSHLGIQRRPIPCLAEPLGTGNRYRQGARWEVGTAVCFNVMLRSVE